MIDPLIFVSALRCHSPDQSDQISGSPLVLSSRPSSGPGWLHGKSRDPSFPLEAIFLLPRPGHWPSAGERKLEEGLFTAGPSIFLPFFQRTVTD